MEFTPENVADAIEGNEQLYKEFSASKLWKQKRKCIGLWSGIMSVSFNN